MLAQELRNNNWQYHPNARLSDEVFNIPSLLSDTLEYKHLLANFLQKHHLNFAPATFYIDDNNYRTVINNLGPGPWILKPSLLNNGQHIKIFINKQEILTHYASAKRLGGPHVLQSYIHPPHLLQGPKKGHKYSLRMLVIIIFPYAVFMYPQGYFNIALSPYEVNNMCSLVGHITNEHLNHDSVNVVQIPSEQYAIFKQFYPKIGHLLTQFFSKFAVLVDNSIHSKVAFLGVDFMLDSQENLYLLEFNHGPCFPISAEHPLQNKLYKYFWQACYADIIPRLYHPTYNELKHFVQLY